MNPPPHHLGRPSAEGYTISKNSVDAYTKGPATSNSTKLGKSRI